MRGEGEEDEMEPTYGAQSDQSVSDVTPSPDMRDKGLSMFKQIMA